PPTMLVRAAGRQWSVPRGCIGRKARVVSMPGGQIRVTVAGGLVAVHDASRGSARINYTEDHYVEAMAGKAWAADADIREQARANLELLEGIGGGL
ncbi:Mu transposase domain-containing protein, partial [Collinsella stercoris]